jgi:hypothetical protein
MQGNIARGNVTNVSGRISYRAALSAKWEDTARSTEAAHIFATSWKKRHGINRNLLPPTVNNLIANLLSSKTNRTILPYVPETLGGPDL